MFKLFQVRPPAHNVWLAFFLLLVLLVGSRAGAESTFASAIDSNGRLPLLAPMEPDAPPPPEPGATDPQGAPENYMMFPDHELWVPQVQSGTGATSWATGFDYPDATLNITRSVTVYNTGEAYGVKLYAKRGRVSRQDRDQVISLENAHSDQFVTVGLMDDELNADQVDTLPESSVRLPGFADILGLAVGDLDKVPDSKGNNHDEIVLAYATQHQDWSYTINVRVLNFSDYDAEIPYYTCAANATTSLGIDSLGGVVGSDTILDVAVADFDGNGMNDIAVTYLRDSTTLVVTTFKYTYKGGSNCALQEAFATTTSLAPHTAIGSLQTDVGDVDGNGVTDLIVAQGLSNPEVDTQRPGLFLFAGNQDLNLQQWVFGELDDVPNSPTLRVQVAAGLFRLDPGIGYDFNRRQILLGWTSGPDTISVQALDWDPDTHSFLELAPAAQFSPYLTDQTWSIAAGAFRGVLAPQNPLWSVVFYGVLDEPHVPAVFYSLYDVATPQTLSQHGVDIAGGSWDRRMPIVAFDVDGNSLFLGAPIHIVADGTITTDYIIYEPPKHAFYNIDPGTAGGYKGQVINLSRFPDFNVTFTTNNTSSVKSSGIQTADWSIGGSNQSSAAGTVDAGINLGFTADDVKTTLGISETVSYNHNQQNGPITSTYQTQSVEYSTTTSADDSVGGSTQNLDIWRYRIYGLPSGAMGSYAAAYYDYYIPAKKVNLVGNSGLDLDWYQPLHENGNILSYPLANNDTFTPSDLGNIVVNGTTVSGTLVPATQITCCGNGGHEDLEFTGSVTDGTEFSSSNTWNESLDVSAAYSAKVSAFGTGVDFSASTDLNFNNSNSSSAASSNAKTTTVSRAITLNFGRDGTGFGYFVYPVMHTTDDGTFKVSHAIQFLQDDRAPFWDNYYGHKPDPALNLPFRFFETTYSNNPAWEPTTDSSRKTIRGFNLLNGTKNPRTNQNDALPLEAVTAGAPLLLQVNLYNYSTGGITNQTPTNADNLQVQFQYAPINGNQETGPRVNIGTITVPQVAPMQIVPAQIAWNTSGLGGSGSCAIQSYRIIVTLDPNNTIDEIYETENPKEQYPYVVVDPENQQPTTTYLDGIDPGQNNQGFAYATVQTPNPNGTCPTGFGADVFLKSRKSLGAVDAVDNKMHTDRVTALRDRPVQLRLKVFSNRPHALYGRVLIYDGNPRDGAPLIADKQVHFGNPKGTVVWFHWIPRTGGKHTIYARLVQRRDDPVQNNARAFVEVNVVKKIK